MDTYRHRVRHRPIKSEYKYKTFKRRTLCREVKNCQDKKNKTMEYESIETSFKKSKKWKI